MNEDLALVGGAVGVPVAGVLASGFTGAGLLGVGTPANSVLLLSWLAGALVALLGTRAVVRRLDPDSPRTAYALVGPLLLAGLLALPGDASWIGKAAVLALVVGAGLLGLRVGPERARRAVGDRGSGSLEFVGIVVLAGVLTAATIGAVIASSPQMRATIEAVICRITGGSCQAGGSALSDDDVVPDDCDVYSEGKSVSAVVDVAFVRLGGTMGLERVEKSDGTVEVSVVDRGEGGLVTSAGARGGLQIGQNTYSADLEAEAAITAGLLAGETWVFKDRDQADAFQRYVERELREDVVSSASPVIGAINSAVEWATDEQPPRNSGKQKSVVRGDVTGTASAEAGFGYGAGVGGSGSFATAIGVEFDRGDDPKDPSDDTRTEFVEVDWEAAGQLGLPMVKGIDGSGSATGVLKIKRNTRGQVVEVAIVDRSSGDFQVGARGDSVLEAVQGGSSSGVKLTGLDFKGGKGNTVVVTRTLPLDTQRQRDAFDDWLFSGGASVTTGGQVVPGVDSVDGSGIAPGLRGREFADRLRREGKTSIVEYDGTSWGLGGVLEAGLGLKVGVDLGYSSESASAVTAYYLGAPGGDGAREAFPLPQCVR